MQHGDKHGDWDAAETSNIIESGQIRFPMLPPFLSLFLLYFLCFGFLGMGSLVLLSDPSEVCLYFVN